MSCTSMPGVCLFIPIQDNHLENVAALATHFPATVYQYDWHICPGESRQFFMALNIPVKRFDLQTLLTDLVSETRRVVFVISAHLSHAIGKAQLKLFTILKQQLPHRVADVFHVGHCMYGCQSCAIKSHNVPLFFTRYHCGTLGFTTQTLRDRLGIAAGIRAGGPRPVVMIAPSVFTLSLLNNADVVDALVALIAQDQAQFVVKPHPLLYHSNITYPSFHRLEAELASVQRLLGKATCAPNAQAINQAAGVEGCGLINTPEIKYYDFGWSSLPALEMADIVITDVDSSLSFEALAMPGLAILAYQPPTHVPSDAELLTHYNVFQTGQQLKALFASVLEQQRDHGHPPAPKLVETQPSGDEYSQDAMALTPAPPPPPPPASSSAPLSEVVPASASPTPYFATAQGLAAPEAQTSISCHRTSATGLTFVSASSRDFFRRLYGEVDGTEVSRLAQSRGWQCSIDIPTETLSVPKLTESVLCAFRGQRAGLHASEQLILGCPSRPQQELYAEWRAHSQKKHRAAKPKPKDRNGQGH